MANKDRLAIIVFIIIIAGAYAIAELDTNDLDALDGCTGENTTLKRNATSWYCDTTHYAQGWFHNVSNHHTITISDTTTYFNLTGFQIDNYEGIDALGNEIQINKQATYKMLGTVSFHGGNNGDYEASLFVNGIKKSACSFHRTTSSTAIGDATMSCIFDCNAGDLLNIRIRDHNAPAQDVNLVAFNFNIIEVK